MSETVITMIYPANIPPVWVQAEPILAPAIAMAGTHEPEDVYKVVMAGKAQLWVQWSGKIDGVAVTEFVDYPAGLYLRVWLTGAAKDAAIEWEKFYDAIYDFAQKSHCKEIEDLGRLGWDKHAEKYATGARRIAVLRRIKIEPKEEVASRMASGG